ncbi:hypothetical protein BDR06DRAFT_735684 [Suillus hirtellus]|nr:hypothetical protein BDR06DRAFT_735684 [Suillus hirtellus]
MQALMGSPVIGNRLAQLSSPAIIALPDPSNEGKGGDRAGAGDGITNEKSTHHTRTSQAKRPREEALQGDISSDVQTPSFADRPSNRRRLLPSVKKPLRRMPPSQPRSFNELMQNNNLRDPRVVVLECKRCKKKQPSATRLCLTVLRLCSQTDEYELSNSCMRCIVDHQKCEWPAGAISKNTEHRVYVSAKYFSPTEDQSAAPKSLGLTLTQSGASAPYVVINSPHKNTVKATSSTRPTPSPSSATTAEQVKHTFDIIQLPTPKRSISPISTWIMELM